MTNVFTALRTLVLLMTTALLSACGGGTSGSSGGTSSSGTSSSGSATSSSVTASVLSVPANDIVWDTTHGLIYLSVPSSYGPGGNVIMAVNPATGQTVTTQFAGSEPGSMAISGDDQYLYVAINGRSSVQRFLLPSLTPDISWYLGANFLSGAYSAFSISVAPGAPHTTAVELGNNQNGSVAVNLGGIMIFDDTTARVTMASATTGLLPQYGPVAWGGSDTTLYSGNLSDLFSLTVDSGGVQLTNTFNNVFNRQLPSGFGQSGFQYDPATDMIYGQDGTVLNPATGAIVGQYPAAGPMIVDSAHGVVTMAVSGSGMNLIDSFDKAHFTAISATSLTNSPEPPNRLVQWGPNAFAFTTRGSTAAAPTGPVYLTGSTATTNKMALSTPVPTSMAIISQVAQPAYNIVWDATHGLIYASVPSASSVNPDSIVAIDPTTGNITTVRAAGSNPDAMAISDDNQYLYVGLDGAASVQRFVLPGLTPDISFSLGSTVVVARAIQVEPGAPHTVAITICNTGSDPCDVGTVVYDDGVARASIGQGTMDSLQWNPDGSELYGENNESTGFDLHVYTVDSAGLHFKADYVGAFTDYNFSSQLHYDATTALLYSDTGFTAFPSTGQPGGIFTFSGVPAFQSPLTRIVPDGALNTAFFLQRETTLANTPMVLKSFDMTHYTPIATVAFPQIPELDPPPIIRWGSNGLAIPGESGIYLITGAFVSHSP
ncbi:MAG TPA: hypothetical protein VNR70_13625 [Steroidobacteraceae bacterium]|nr:hypothetical protein [Steroidobacteraceae bacterium]